MIAVRRAEDRGSASLGWLNSKHSFSFGDYYDPNNMGFGSLRVINEDRIEPAQGFGRHGHRDMEIVTYMIEGALEHKDNMGNGSVLRVGDVQRMSAGTGVQHSEFNHSDAEKAHVLQIWLLPERTGITPGWEERTFPVSEKRNQLRLIVSRDARNGSLMIHQSIDIFATILDEGAGVSHDVANNHIAWIQVVSGKIYINDEQLSAGDGAAIEDTKQLHIRARAESELLLFDMG